MYYNVLWTSMSLGILNVTIKNFIDEENDNLKKNFVAIFLSNYHQSFHKAAVGWKFSHCYFLRDFFDALCNNC